MNDLEKVIVSLVNELVSANAVRKEAIIEALVGNSKSDSSYVLSFSTAKKIIEKIIMLLLYNSLVIQTFCFLIEFCKL